MTKNVENYVKWVDKNSRTDALKIVFSWNYKTNHGTVNAYICDESGLRLQRNSSCTRQEFDACRRMGDENVAMIFLGEAV